MESSAEPDMERFLRNPFFARTLISLLPGGMQNIFPDCSHSPKNAEEHRGKYSLERKAH